jgi:hypothetical protein
MIKFFRKKRLDLMEKSQTGKYLKYAVGEILLVVIGILIALQLNQYKESYEMNSQRQNYYNQLLVDLQKDKDYIEEMLVNIDTFKNSYDKYLTFFNEPGQTPEQLSEIIRSMNHSIELISFNTRTVESLEKSGDIKIIPQDIRNELLDLKRSQDFLTEKVKGNGIIQAEFFKEMIISGFSMSQKIQDQPVLTQYFKDIIDDKKTLMLFDGNLGWKRSLEKSKDLNELLEKITELTEHLNEKLV